MQRQATSVFAPERSSELFDQSEATSPVGYRPPVGPTTGHKPHTVGKLSGVSRRRDCTQRDSELNKSGLQSGSEFRCVRDQ